MRNGMMWMTVGSLGLALCAGCMGPEMEPASTAESKPAARETTEADALLSLEVEPGHSVTFYEPAPGGLYLVERMTPAQSFVLTGKESSDALLAFAKLRPGAPVPEALQAAYDRARNLPDDASAREAKAGGGQPEAARTQAPGLGSTEQALTSSSSATTFVNTNDGCAWGPTMSFCKVNWANGFFASTTATSGLCIVDHYSGNGVTIQITVGATITSTFQGAGTIAQYSLGVAGASTTRRIDVTNASGDSFHAGCRWGV
ncbi:hypothetical protein F0U61_50695 [Archangium violaceum]|uniref:hypothetical protein n=1 Tax=Archangium violaceum TaxID=83451 RepID=UPI002B2E9997|nr:hypothetical protein F0U61_50695 [Archangium violaceum]